MNRVLLCSGKTFAGRQQREKAATTMRESSGACCWPHIGKDGPNDGQPEQETASLCFFPL